MAGTITSLQFQKHSADRVNIYLDGRFAFGVSSLEAARLHVGTYLGDEDIAQLQSADEVQKAYDRAVRFLGYRPRSTAEVRRHLARTMDDAAVIEAILAKLAEQGYLNDAEFARYWVENREQFRPKGSLALRQELRQHGLDAETIDVALADLAPDESAYAAARPRAMRMVGPAQPDPETFRRKLADFLTRRGFQYEVVRDVVARLADELGVRESHDDD